MQLLALALLAHLEAPPPVDAKRRRGSEMRALRKQSQLYTLYRPDPSFPKFISWQSTERLALADGVHDAIVHVHQDAKTGVPRHVFFELGRLDAPRDGAIHTDAKESEHTVLRFDLFYDGSFSQRGTRRTRYRGETALLPHELAVLTPYVQAAIKHHKGLRLRYRPPKDPTDLTVALSRPDIAFEVLSYLFVAAENRKSLSLRDLYVGLGRKYFEAEYFFGEWLKELLRRKLVVSVPGPGSKGTIPIKLGERGRDLLRDIKRKKGDATPAAARSFGVLLADAEVAYEKNRQWMEIFDQPKNRDLIRRIDAYGRSTKSSGAAKPSAAVTLSTLLSNELPSGRWSNAEEIRARLAWLSKRNLVRLYGRDGEKGIVVTSSGQDVIKD